MLKHLCNVELKDGKILEIYGQHTTLGVAGEPSPLPIVTTMTVYNGQTVRLSAGVDEKKAIDYTLYLLGGGPSIIDGKVYAQGKDGYQRLSPINRVTEIK